MGRFVNPDSSAFQVALNSRIYVDKTGLIEYTNSVLDTTNAYICNSRPRRFTFIDVPCEQAGRESSGLFNRLIPFL